MSLDVKVGEHCTVVVTTQASTKVSKVVILPFNSQDPILPSSHCTFLCKLIARFGVQSR